MVGPKYAEYKCTLTTIEKMYYSPGQIQTCRRTQLTSWRQDNQQHKRKKLFFVFFFFLKRTWPIFHSICFYLPFFRKVSVLFLYFLQWELSVGRDRQAIWLSFYLRKSRSFLFKNQSFFFFFFFWVGCPPDRALLGWRNLRIPPFTVLFRSAQFVAGLKKKKKFSLFRERTKRACSSIHPQWRWLRDKVTVSALYQQEPHNRNERFFLSFVLCGATIKRPPDSNFFFF